MRFWGAVVSLALGGCLLPQDDTVLPEIPRPRNTVPVVVDASPPRETTIRVGENCKCPNPSFTVKVIDPDPEEIRSRWFVDVQGGRYDQATYADGKRVPYEGTATRNKLVESPPTLCALNNSALLLPTTNDRPHIVEVFIADGEFGGARDDSVVAVKPEIVALPDGGTAEDVKRAVNLVWLVHSDPTPCQ